MSTTIRVSVFLLLALVALGQAKVVRKSLYPSAQAALDACSPGDVLLFDGGEPGILTDPPDSLQIIDAAANWVFNKTVTGLVFFNHTPRITQNSGLLRRCIFTDISMPAKFTGLDSCLFVPIKLNHYCSPCIEVEGFVRYASFMHNNYLGSSHMGLVPTMVDHKSSIVINATHPMGDGSGTIIANIITHSQGDWTPVHIVNGRRISVAHINSEYTEWANQYVKIENGIECALIHNTPGGRVADWLSTLTKMNDGTLGYKTLSSRNGLWAVNGQANMLIGGQSYVSFRSTITTWCLSDISLCDPYFSRWNPLKTVGVNLAPSIRNFGFGANEIGGPGSTSGAAAFVMSSAARCTTVFLDSTGSIKTAGLKDKSLPAGPTLLRPYMPPMPRLKLDSDGPGENMTGKSGADIAAALNANKTVYLGPGVYTMPATVISGTIWGAGMDKTTLKFPAGQRCIQSGVKAYNLTIEGGSVGWAQSKIWKAIEDDIMNVRFRGQTVCGVTLGNAQNSHISFLEFDNCNVGIKECQDDINCGEDGTPGGTSMIDKINVYCCTFKNCATGIGLGIGNNGYCSFMGCRFENCGTGIKITRTRGANGKCEGFYVVACDFKDCAKATEISGGTVIHNCTVTGKSGSVGFNGDLQAVVSCSITGCEPAITAGSYAVISDTKSDGSINRSATTWVGISKFSNVNAENGAFIGTTDISRYVNTAPYKPDQTPPTAPKNIKVAVSGSDHVITWDPATDEESGIRQYIIVHDGARIGRTDMNFAGYPHYGEIAPDGVGTYRHKTRYVHKNAAGKSTDYQVLAVNCAHIRSDNVMDMLFMSPVNRFAKPADQYMYHLAKKSDTVVVPQGIPVIKGINKPYTAFRFPVETATGIIGEERVPGVRSSATVPEHIAEKNMAVYDLRGRRVAIHGTNAALKGGAPHSKSMGVYVIPALRSTRLIAREK